jgi:hypothetical protein
LKKEYDVLFEAEKINAPLKGLNEFGQVLGGSAQAIGES